MNIQEKTLSYSENKQNFRSGQRINEANLRGFTYRGGIRL